MRQEVVSYKEAHEDPVVHAPLEVKGKGQAGHGQLSGQVLETCRQLFHIDWITFHHLFINV